MLLAVNSMPPQHFNIDSLLKENKSEFTILTIKRNSLPDFLFDAQQRNNIYSNTINGDDNKYKQLNKFGELRLDDGIGPGFKSNSNGAADYQILSTNDTFNGPVAQIRRPFFSRMTEMSTVNRLMESENLNTNDQDLEDPYSDPDFYNIEYPPRLAGFATRNLDSSSYVNTTSSPQVFTVRLEINGGPLGITLSGSEDLKKPILISGLTEGGAAHSTGLLNLGDELLAINGENVQGNPLSNATKLLQKVTENIVELKVSRSRFNDTENQYKNFHASTPQPQAIYAQIQRRPRSPSILDTLSNGSREGKYQSIYVKLSKDNVYDDYGFSLSDGLYEKAVYINKIRTGGPADLSGVLKSFDRIIQVNGTKTQDFDCCLIVPLIAAAGDEIELVVERQINN